MHAGPGRPKGIAAPPPVLCIVRHGEAGDGRWPIPAEARLTPKGRAQARTAANALRQHLDQRLVVVASDLPRAQETARTISRLLGADLRLDPRLREMEFGWEREAPEEILRRVGADRLAAFQRDPAAVPLPGAEPFALFWRRIEAALRDLSGNCRGCATAVVAHDGVNRAMQLLAQGLGPTDWQRALPWRHGEVRCLPPRLYP